MLNQIKLNIGRHICLSVYLCLYKKAYLCASDFLWEKAKTYTLEFSIIVRGRRLCENTSKTVSSANKWKEWKVMQPKKREITKKNVSVPVLFLYFKSYLYKTLIYSVLSYIKITFYRFLIQGISQHALKVSVLHNFTNIWKLAHIRMDFGRIM